MTKILGSVPSNPSESLNADPAINFGGTAAKDVKAFCRWAGIGRSTFYKLVLSKRLKVRKLGRKTVVLEADAKAFIDSLPAR